MPDRHSTPPGPDPSGRPARNLWAAVRRAARRLERLPSRWLRIPLGVALILAGLLGFLPVLGFWMLPLGLSLLAVDFPPLRRLIRRVVSRFRGGRAGGQQSSDGA